VLENGACRHPHASWFAEDTRLPKSSRTALLAFCRSLPGTTEDIKWEDHLVFSVGGKMYAIFDTGAPEAFSFKVTSAVFPMLTQERGIHPAPYLAQHSWVRCEHSQVLPRQVLEELLGESHEIVASKLPKRVRVSLGLA
jgi:predicted DNA-binding protein (MmcQ/YjbR family)